MYLTSYYTQYHSSTILFTTHLKDLQVCKVEVDGGDRRHPLSICIAFGLSQRGCVRKQTLLFPVSPHREFPHTLT